MEPLSRSPEAIQQRVKAYAEIALSLVQLVKDSSQADASDLSSLASQAKNLREATSNLSSPVSAEEASGTASSPNTNPDGATAAAKAMNLVASEIELTDERVSQIKSYMADHTSKKELDSNGDGKISLEDWKAVYWNMMQEVQKDNFTVPAHSLTERKSATGGENAAHAATTATTTNSTAAVAGLAFSNYTPVQMEAYVTRLFKTGDKDKNGTLSMDEIRALLTLSSFPFDMGTAEAIMKEADKNGDGVLDLGEFKALLLSHVVQVVKKPVAKAGKSLAFANYTPEQREAYIVRLFKVGDKDNSGTLTKAEISALLQLSSFPFNMGKIEHVMQKADKNGDGVLDLEEFKTLLCAHVDVIVATNADSSCTKDSNASRQTTRAPSPPKVYLPPEVDRATEEEMIWDPGLRIWLPRWYQEGANPVHPDIDMATYKKHYQPAREATESATNPGKSGTESAETKSNAKSNQINATMQAWQSRLRTGTSRCLDLSPQPYPDS